MSYINRNNSMLTVEEEYIGTVEDRYEVFVIRDSFEGACFYDEDGNPLSTVTYCIRSEHNQVTEVIGGVDPADHNTIMEAARKTVEILYGGPKRGL